MIIPFGFMKGENITPVSYILDTYTAEVAFSFQKLSTTATNCCVIRRDSDDSETTVVLENTGSISLSSTVLAGGNLGDWVGINNAYIKTMIDQTGNGNDFTSTTTNKQPLLINAGVLNLDSGGNVSMSMDDTDDILSVSGLSTSSIKTAFSVLENSDNKFIMFQKTGFSNANCVLAESGSTSTSLYTNSGTPTFYIDGSVFAGTNRGDLNNSLSTGVPLILSVTNFDVSSWAGFFSISGYFSGSWQYDGNFSEFILFDSDEASDRTIIESNIINRY